MAFSPETYALCLKNTAEKIDEALTSVYNYKGSVDTIADLPLTNNKVGDTYDVKSEGGQNYGWNGESWDSLGVNREATDTDLGLIKKKDNTFNTTTFVGDITAINSDNTSITGSGITSVNGEGNFEVSKPTTILASKTNNIAGEVVTISPSSRINLTTAGINLVTTGPDRMGITINANDMPLTLKGNIVINGNETTHINTPVIINQDMEASNLTAQESIYTKKIYSNNIYGQNFGSNADGASSLITHTGAKNNIVLGANNTYLGPDPGSTVLNTENIIIGRSNRIASVAANNFIIGQSNEMYANYSTILGFSNHINKDYSLAKGQENEVNALGATVFGFKNNAIYSAEFGLVSGVSNTLNGKVSTVLGDNLRGSTETGSLTIGTFNKTPSSSATDIFIVGNGINSTSRSNAMRLTRGGTLYYQSAVGGGADYAEFYEWSDGNPNDEDRIGCFVTFDFNKEYNYKSSRQLPHIKIAQPGDYILGVISGNPALIGNGDEEWRERWLYDEFDRPIVKTIEVPIMELQEVETGEYKTEIQYDENDNEIEVQVPITETKEVDTGKTERKYVQVLNPDYDENKTYKSRIDRPEWEPIGMLGNLSIKDDGTCIPGEFCKCGVDGIATHADKRDFDTYLVTRRINDNVVKIVFK